MLYRVLKDLSFGDQTVPRGGLVRGSKLAAGTAERLVERGALAPVAAPPVEVLPGWKTRAKRLAAIGLVDAAQVVEADPAEIARSVGVQVVTAEHWQSDAEAWLRGKTPSQAGG